MKIAVAHKQDNIFQHFGQTEEFKIYTVEEDKIVNSEVVSTNGCQHGELSGFLAGLCVESVICGDIGPGAKGNLASTNIMVYPGVEGKADASVEQLLAGTLEYDPTTLCDHDDERHLHHSGTAGKAMGRGKGKGCGPQRGNGKGNGQGCGSQKRNGNGQGCGPQKGKGNGQGCGSQRGNGNGQGQGCGSQKGKGNGQGCGESKGCGQESKQSNCGQASHGCGNGSPCGK